MIKAILFDFDGTLSNRQMNAYLMYRDFLKSYFPDLNEIEFEAVLQDMLTYDCNGIMDMHLRLIPFRNKYRDLLPDDLEEKLTEFSLKNMYRFTVLKDETIEVLEKLKGKYKLGILSNGNPFSQHHKISQVKIEDYFDTILVSGDLGIHKPDVKIFEYAAEQLGVRCEECLMVGDVFSSDILGAIKAGMLPVWILEDTERPALDYHGYRIEKLDQLFEILEKEDEKA
ncbi:MAG: HAD family hydrolase [Erysipelotrichaceae bacterium]|nr:HAD family hydrolase [Erysipelotrichaceae bacterium]